MASFPDHQPAPKPPDIQLCGGDGGTTTKTPENLPNSDNRRTSFASIVAGSSAPTRRQGLRPRFPPLSLPARQVSTKDGRPAISFTGAEIGACQKRFEFSLVAKFTVGRPPIPAIQEALMGAWNLRGRATISEIWDGRHVLVILDSEDDVRTALSSPLHKIGHAFFRLFRWSPDYNPKKESKFSTVWVRLHGLPLGLYDTAFVEAIVSTFGYFVAVDDRTKACVAVKYARACVELDVTQPIPDSVWIALPNEKGFWQSIEIETNISYCNKCRVHGHNISSCRKFKHAPSKAHHANPTPNAGGTSKEPKPVVLQGTKQKEGMNEQWVPVTHKRNKKKGNVDVTEGMIPNASSLLLPRICLIKTRSERIT